MHARGLLPGVESAATNLAQLLERKLSDNSLLRFSVLNNLVHFLSAKRSFK